MTSLILLKIYFRSKQENNEALIAEFEKFEDHDKYIWIIEKEGMNISTQFILQKIEFI